MRPMAKPFEAMHASLSPLRQSRVQPTPARIFFIAGTSQTRMPLALFLLSVVAMSVLFAWLVNRCAGSVVVALLLHTAINCWPSIIPVRPTSEGHRPTTLLVAPLVVLALGLLAPPEIAGWKAGALQ